MTSKTPSDKVAVIAIDEQSIANIGRWPWPREVQAKLVDQLVASKAKVITSTIILSEAQKDPGLAYVEKMLDIYNKAYPGAVQEVPGVSPIGGQTPAATGATPPAGRRRDRQDPGRGIRRAQQRRALRRQHQEGGQRVAAHDLRRSDRRSAARQARQAAARIHLEEHDRQRDRRGRAIHLRQCAAHSDRAVRQRGRGVGLPQFAFPTKMARCASSRS